MGKLYLYGVFHANLNFSYIPKDFYPQILRRCYWPLLRIVEEQRVPLGLEFSAHTLQVVNSLDPTFVKRLRELWQEDACEVIGSGYVQAIMPLIPARVNRENLRQGNAIYQELLGRRPTVAYVNELVYSAGLPRLYRDAGYEALMINWESALPVHADPELRYRPCAVSVGEDGRIPVIWHSIALYRDFQRCVEREISLDTYMAELLSHVPERGERAASIYCSDWEVFDFKPWRAHPEGFGETDLGEMDRIAGLLSRLKGRADIEFVTPGSLLARFPHPILVRPESSAYPLPYKKQDVHSMMRWAVGGRDSIRLNTQCNQLYRELLLVDWYLERRQGATALRVECQRLWKELCFLWNSDLRTYTTEEKYLEYRNRMGAALAQVRGLREACQPADVAPGELWLTNCGPVPAVSEPVSFTIVANGSKASDHPTYDLQLDDQRVPCQVTLSTAVGDDVRRLTMEAMPALEVDQAKIGMIRQTAPSHSRQHTEYRIDTGQHVVETPSVRISFLPLMGGTIETLAFPSVFPKPLICRVREATPQSACQADGLFPGDLIIQDWLGRSITDHQETELQYPEPGERLEIFVPVRCFIQTELGMVWKTYRVYLHQPRVDLDIRFQWRDVVPKYFRLGRVALNPSAFHRDSLYYATVNGGEDVERFMLQGQHVRQDEPLEADATVRGCLGATEGWVVIGDAEKGLGFITRPAALYSVPIMHYEEMDNDPRGFLLTLAHSLGEQDETSHTLWRGHSTWNLSILAEGGDLISQVRASALLANGRLVAQSEINSDLERL